VAAVCFLLNRGEVGKGKRQRSRVVTSWLAFILSSYFFFFQKGRYLERKLG
jgi:hypothetical protein